MEGYQNYNICLVLTKNSTDGFKVEAIYMDDLNLVGSPHEIATVTSYLKEFEMKELRKTRFYFRIQVGHLTIRIFIHQSAYEEI